MAVLGSPIQISGSHGEGGGALLRTALFMSALTEQQVRITTVRAGTDWPGLNNEDVAIIRALGISCGADTDGIQVGDHSLDFSPTRRPHGLSEKIEPPEGEGVSANALIVLNTLLPVMARTGVYCSMSVRGETYGHNVLSYDYFTNVTLAASRKMGLYAFPDMTMAGFGRGSVGEASLEVEPSAIQALNWEDRGDLIGIRATVVTGELPEPVAQRGVVHLERLAYHAGFPIEAEASQVRAKAPGAFVTVWAEFENGIGGATAMGARGIRMEALAQMAFDSMQEWLKGDATVDPFLADQILPTLCMAEGESLFKVSKLTDRFLTMVWVIKQFLPIHLTVKGRVGQPGTVVIRR